MSIFINKHYRILSNMKKTKNLTFCVSKETIEKLDKHYHETMIPKSKLVSRLLDEYFKKLDKEK